MNFLIRLIPLALFTFSLQALDHIKPITTYEEFKSVILQKKGIACVKFFATWCGPCKSMANVISELAQEYKGKVSFFEIDINKSNLSEIFNVMSLPTVIIFKDGIEKSRIVGLREKKDLKAYLNLN